jgi:FMN phosphatase YigB (HAD superfamily)
MEKNLEVVLFDLDGTLLPMDQDVFVQTYFGLLAKNLSNYGYEPKKLIESIWLGTKSM